MRQLLLLIILLMGSFPAVQAETFTGSGAYSNPANWSSRSVPGSGDAVIFDGTAAGPVTIDVPASVASITVAATFPYTITQSADVMTSGTWTMNGGTWDTASQMLTVGGAFTVAPSGAEFVAVKGSVVLAGSSTLSNPNNPFAYLTIAAGHTTTLVSDVMVTSLCSVAGQLVFSDFTTLHLRGSGQLLNVTGNLNAINPNRGRVSYEAQSNAPVEVSGGSYGWTQLSFTSIGGAQGVFEQEQAITAIDSFYTSCDENAGSVDWETNGYDLTSSSWIAIGNWGASAGPTTVHAGASQITAPALCWVTMGSDQLYLEQSRWVVGEWAMWTDGINVDPGTSTVVVNNGIGPFWTTVPHEFYNLQINGPCPLYGLISVGHDLTVLNGGTLSTQNLGITVGHDLTIQRGAVWSQATRPSRLVRTFRLQTRKAPSRPIRRR